MHIFRAQIARGALVQLTEHRFGHVAGLVFAHQLKTVAAIAHLNAQALFDFTQMRVDRPAKTGQPGIVGRQQHHIARAQRRGSHRGIHKTGNQAATE